MPRHAYLTLVLMWS